MSIENPFEKAPEIILSKDQTIEKNNKKISTLFKVEIILLSLSLFSILVTFVSSFFSISEDIFSAFLGISFITYLLGIASFILLWITFIYTVTVLIKVKRIKKFLNSSSLNSGTIGEQGINQKKLRKLSLIVKWSTGVFIFLFLIPFCIRVVDSIIYSKKIKEEHTEIAHSNIKEEGKKIQETLQKFKNEIVALQNRSFTGYGSIQNDGSCLEPNEGSIFNPGTNFEPREVINEETGTLLDNYPVWIKENVEDMMFNNMKDAKCFSNQDHFAYQVPSFYEEEYPVFYCIDDVHKIVQTRNKQIKGASCDDVDVSYVAPNPRPTPDTPFYKNYNITGREE